MTTAAAPEFNTAALASKAMLVSLTISAWGNRRTDRKITKEVAEQHGSEIDMGRYNKTLIRKTALAAINSAMSQARTYWQEQTLPWLDAGSRMLPAANYFAYMEQQRKLKAQFDQAVDELVGDFPNHIEDARRRLNGIFDLNDYPSPAALRRKFDMAVEITQLPAGKDFRVDISEAEAASIRVEIEQRLHKAFQDATLDLFERVGETLRHLRDKLANYQVDAEGKITNPFRDSAIGNLREIVELLPRLNVTGDERIAELGRQLSETLCKAEPGDLRADERERAKAVRTADDILAQMAGYLGEDC